MSQRREIEIGGRPLIVETGSIARQADGAVTLRYGDTVILVTACAAWAPPPGGGIFTQNRDKPQRI